MIRPLKALQDERIAAWIALVTIAGGMMARLAWLFLAPASRLVPHRSEMWFVADAFARTNTFADAYGPGSGLTAHVGPVNVLIAGYIYRLLGVGTPAAEFALSVLAALVTGGAFYLLYRLGRQIGIGIVPRLLAILVLSFWPLNFYVEMVDFRVREGGLLSLLYAGGLLLVLRSRIAGGPDMRRIVLVSLFLGFTFLINPVMALAVGLPWGIVVLRTCPARRWPLAGAIGIACVLAVSAPWMVRNWNVYHKVMLSRSNFGLELAIANHPAALSTRDPQAVFNQRISLIHPAWRFRAHDRAFIAAWTNDADYANRLKGEAVTWMRHHKADTARIMLRHMGEIVLPPKWQYNLYGDGGGGHIGIKYLYTTLISVFGIAGLLIGLWRDRWPFGLVALSLVPFVLVYSLVQPTLRYRYPVDGLFVLLACYAGWTILTLLYARLRRPPVRRVAA